MQRSITKTKKKLKYFLVVSVLNPNFGIAHICFFQAGAAEVAVFEQEVGATRTNEHSHSWLGRRKGTLSLGRGTETMPREACFASDQTSCLKEMPDLTVPGSNVELCGSLISYSTLIY